MAHLAGFLIFDQKQLLRHEVYLSKVVEVNVNETIVGRLVVCFKGKNAALVGDVLHTDNIQHHHPYYHHDMYRSCSSLNSSSRLYS